MFHFNVESTLQTVRAAKDLGARVVFMSSSGTVGCFKHPDLTADEHAPYAEGVVSRWPYYASKIEAERQAQRLADKLGVELVIARMPVLLGPKDHRFRSTGHVLRVLEGRIPAVPPGGMHFADIRDVAAATARLTQLPRVRSVYHFPGTQASLSAFFKMVCEVSGAKVTERKLPGWLLLQIASGIERWSDTARLPGTARWPDPVVLEMSTCHWGISSLWTHAELDYAPRLARQTLSDTVAWVRTHQAEASAARH
jgi:nucleoside-diphosphate-sugar epimerase